MGPHGNYTSMPYSRRCRRHDSTPAGPPLSAQLSTPCHFERGIADHRRSSAIVAQFEDPQQFCHGQFFLVATRLEHLGDVGTEVILNQKLIQTPERLLDS